MNLPNKLTVFRIILVPIMVIVSYLKIDSLFLGIPVSYIIMDLIFVIASITDKLDGSIARKNNLVTNFGKFLDPIADKILVLSALMIMVEIGKIPAWIPIIVLFREFLISGYRLIAATEGGKVISASIWGKTKTVTQMIAIILAFLDKYNFAEFIYKNGMTSYEYILNITVTMLLIISVIATIFSGVEYLKNGKELLKDK